MRSKVSSPLRGSGVVTALSSRRRPRFRGGQSGTEASGDAAPSPVSALTMA
jgi:hypothetical protein